MIKRFLFYSLSVFLLIALLSSCGYKQSILFKTGQLDSLKMRTVLTEAEENYRIDINDKLEIQLFTYGGELILDPNKELAREIGMGGMNGRFNNIKTQSYLVQTDSTIFLPKIGKVNVYGLTLYECDTMLAKRFEEYYQDPFVVTEVINRRMSVIGPTGAKVIPLVNEKISLIEVIALYAEVSPSARMNKVRIIRGDLNNPEVQVVDLTTIKGMTEANLEIKANDIVYIEPRKKFLSETLKEVAPLISLITSTISVYLLISNVTR